MRRIRVIPIMLINEGRAVVTSRFGKPVYVGDPINSIRVFNEKEVDEMVILDITPKSKRNGPDYDLVAKLASESFMPLTYGGHIVSLPQAEKVIGSGIEKISFNTSLFSFPETVHEVSSRYGNQSVVASIDVKRSIFGDIRFKVDGGRKTIRLSTSQLAGHLLKLGVGEVLLTSIDHDGMRGGYNIPLIETFGKLFKVPIVACGGAQSIDDFIQAVEAGASAVAAGAMFYFKGNRDAVLINYPDQTTLTERFYQKFH
ncbi:MAG: HisA/HisF-related TIM barrel protein [Cyclobacteriaceae bacterium]|nr:imidazole glycerol phosphate synthase subunit HisF [Cyclobacteriaceae bacterium]MCB9238257.1 imidazole glycerol phosphate synthase subunit HisF [Flammeovirgaceae bacterium]MCB0498981.1 imidazole glycerol phosphate synthase subunit HisF [Cyclobacteriaceae bacterium]MCO5272182.1 HisA/HisF-related TIM barrel protein [Cyclobacteriaceae bacterium]MCW5902703.1 imidazole glycerol phosphate synthase subunit HisF [Cyclobacteriaceae bacterium]